MDLSFFGTTLLLAIECSLLIASLSQGGTKLIIKATYSLARKAIHFVFFQRTPMDFGSLRHTSTSPSREAMPTSLPQREEQKVASESSSTQSDRIDQSRGARNVADRGNEARIRQQLGKHSRSGSKSPPSNTVKHQKVEHSTVATNAVISWRATRDDIPGVMEFIQNLDEDSYQKRFSDAPREIAMDVLREDMSQEPERFFIARVGDKIAGITDYECVDHEYSSAHVACVSIVLNAEHHGRGIGKQLTDLMEHQLREDGFQYTVARVYPGNNSHMHRLVNKGWEETGESRSIDHDDDNPHEFWMALDPNLIHIEPQRLP